MNIENKYIEEMKENCKKTAKKKKGSGRSKMLMDQEN